MVRIHVKTYQYGSVLTVIRTIGISNLVPVVKYINVTVFATVILIKRTVTTFNFKFLQRLYLKKRTVNDYADFSKRTQKS